MKNIIRIILNDLVFHFTLFLYLFLTIVITANYYQYGKGGTILIIVSFFYCLGSFGFVSLFNLLSNIIDNKLFLKIKFILTACLAIYYLYLNSSYKLLPLDLPYYYFILFRILCIANLWYYFLLSFNKPRSP